MNDCAPRLASKPMDEQEILFRDRSLPDASVQQSFQDWLPSSEIHQISVGGFQGQLREIRHAQGSVFFERQSCSVHKRGCIEDDLCTVSYARAKAPSSEFRFSEYHALDRSLYLLPRACEFDLQVDGDTETVYFLFSQSRLLERARALDPARWEREPDQLLVFDAPGRRSLEAFALHLYASPSFQTNSDMTLADSRLSGLIMDGVLLALNSASPGHRDAGAMTRRRARRVTRRAIEYIEAELNRHRCPGIVDICQQIQVSERTLQYSFREILGLTPCTYLRYLRLNRAQAELARPDHPETTVTHVATSWHFFHLSRFSNDYLHLFGELPSTTLKRGLS